MKSFLTLEKIIDMKRTLLFLLMLGAWSSTIGQSDSTWLRKFHDISLTRGKSYLDLKSLCKDIGARVTGSAEAAMAVKWGKKKLEGYNFDKVYLQEIEVPHWERGTTESAWVEVDGQTIKLDVLALGGSIGTNGLLEGELVVFRSMEELKKANRKEVEGKIVLLNKPMDAKMINTFKAYGGCWPIRGLGAIESANLGAKAVVIRSLGLPIDDHPHTGSMYYVDSVEKIPAGALSTANCEMLQRHYDLGKKLKLFLEMDCKSYPNKKSHNVIAEITGTDKPEEIIAFGGHLDSWDVGEGAHDDGAGIVHSMEALRLLKVSGYQPKHTLRVVFFMNEENGNFGGKSYAKIAKEKNEKHIAAIESDRGGFAPRGFSVDGPQKYVDLLKSFKKLFDPYYIHDLGAGYGGVDINPLKNEYKGIPLFGFIPDSQRYFDLHHSQADVFETVNKRELELGAAAMASLIYLLDKEL